MALAGGTGTVSVVVGSGVSWTAASSANWVSVTPESGIGSGTVYFTVSLNSGVATRSALLTIAGKTFSITQTGADVNIDPGSAKLPCGASAVQVQVNALSTTSWDVNPYVSWISVSAAGTQAGSATVNLLVSANDSFLKRTGTVSIGSATFTVTQEGTPTPTLDILPAEATSAATGAKGGFDVLASPDAPWSVESQSPWITISQGSSGAGGGNVQYLTAANPDLTSRVGLIKVTPAVSVPEVDLSLQLESHVYNTNTDASGWGRNLSGSLTQTFNGTNALTLQGQNFYRLDDAFSVALWFRVTEINAVNRLFEATRAAGSYSTLYTDASNNLVFKSGSETLTSSLLVSTNKTYQVVLTAGTNRTVTIYAGERGASLSQVGSKTFAQAPFLMNYVQPSGIRLGSGNQPSAGNLSNGSLNDFRIYSRTLSFAEALAIFGVAGTSAPYSDTSDKGDASTCVEYNFRGQSFPTGGTTMPSAFTNSLAFFSSWSATSDTAWTTNTFTISGRMVDQVQGSGSYASESRSAVDGISGRTVFFYCHRICELAIPNCVHRRHNGADPD